MADRELGGGVMYPYQRPHRPGEQNGNCHACCVAGMFGYPLEEVPDWESVDEPAFRYLDRIDAWLRERGWILVPFEMPDNGKWGSWSARLGLHIRSGPTTRSEYSHSCLYCGDELEHDPAGGEGVLPRDGFWLLYLPHPTFAWSHRRIAAEHRKGGSDG